MFRTSAILMCAGARLDLTGWYLLATPAANHPPTFSVTPLSNTAAKYLKQLQLLIRDYGAAAYREARERERDVVILPDGTTHAGRTPAHWRRVALIVARKAGKAASGAPILVVK
jgi:hypothetical protein